MYEGAFSDGKTAVLREVRVEVTRSRLIIIGEEEAALDEWSIEGLRVANAIHGAGQPIRLAHRDHGEARLAFESPEILGALGNALPGAGRRRMWGKRFFVFAAGTLAAAVLLIGALIAALPWAVDRLSVLVPARIEDAVGDGIMGALGAKYPTCGAPRGKAALDTLVARLTAGRRPRTPIRVRVFRLRQPNAFAAPGGHIGVFEGLLHFAATPEEFAGVLAHEMGHAAQRHPTKSLLRAAGLGLIFSALTGDPSALAAAAGKLTETLLSLSFTREAELEADREALAMLSRAGIRSDGLSRFLARIKRRAPARSSGGYFSTHPAAGERIAAMRSQIRQGGPAMTVAEWLTFRRICSNTGSW